MFDVKEDEMEDQDHHVHHDELTLANFNAQVKSEMAGDAASAAAATANRKNFT